MKEKKKTILCAQSKLMQTCASALFAQHPAGCCRNTPGDFSTRCRKKQVETLSRFNMKYVRKIKCNRPLSH